MDHQVLLDLGAGGRAGTVDVLVDLAPDRYPPAGLRVQHDDARVDRRVVVHPEVRDRRDARRGDVLVLGQPGDDGEDLRAGTEPVAAVPLLGLHRLALGVARHRQRVEIEAPTGRAGRVRLREPVVRIGQQALGAVDRVTAGRVGGIGAVTGPVVRRRRRPVVLTVVAAAVAMARTGTRRRRITSWDSATGCSHPATGATEPVTGRCDGSQPAGQARSTTAARWSDSARRGASAEVGSPTSPSASTWSSCTRGSIAG